MSDQSLLARLAHKGHKMYRAIRLRMAMKHVHGPAKFDLGPDDVVVVVLVKDAVFYLDAFLNHYRGLGVQHFVFVDNGSTDGTLDRLAREPGTITLQCTLPHALYEGEFRRHGAQAYARNHWVLFADADELLDFKGSATLGMSGLAQYMRTNGYTAMMAQMLDLFPKDSIKSFAKAPFDHAIEAFQSYDLTDIIRHDYHDYGAIEWSYFMRTNTTSNDALKFMFGGIRLKHFGEECCLSKHPLVFIDDAAWPNPHPHTAAHVNVADISAVLKHYKFTDDPFARDLQTIRDGTVSHGGDKLRLQVVRDTPNISFHSENAQEWAGVEALIDQGFLVHTPAYDQFIAARATA